MLDGNVYYCVKGLLNTTESPKEVLDKLSNAKDVQTLIFALDNIGHGLYSETYGTYVEYEDIDEEKNVIILSHNDIDEEYSAEKVKKELTIKEYPNL